MTTPTITRRATTHWRIPAMLALMAILVTLLLAATATQANPAAPEAPTNPMAHLIVPDNGDPRIRVSWDHPAAPVTGYTISRADGQTFTAGPNATTFSDHTIEPGTAYSYSVTAQNALGASADSEPATATVPDAPSQPASLAAEVAEIQTTDEAASVTLTWAGSTVPAVEACETSYPLKGYTVLRSDGTTETEIATPDAGATSFTDTTADFGAAYTYRVMAKNAIGDSQAAQVTVTVPLPPVPSPSGLTASIEDPFDGNVSLSWDSPTEGAAIVGYLVFRYLGSDPYQGTDIPVTLAEMATQTVLVDDTAQAGVTYSYIVIARSADNVSEPSNTATIEAPAPLSGLTATAGDSAIDLSWSAPVAGTAGTYRIERQQQGGDRAFLADTATTRHSDDTAQPNVQYHYRVQHRNQYGGSTWTESEPVTIVAVPSKPTGLTATAEGNDTALAWTAPGSPFIDGYRVRHHTGDGVWTTIADHLASDTTQYRHAGAPADVTNEYAVQAYNSAGDGPWSDPASVTRITLPGIPKSVSAALDGNDILVSWTRPDSAHVSGYTVRHQAGDGQHVESDRLPESQTSFRMTGVSGDTIYRVAVRTHNAAGESSWSDDVEVMRRLAPSVPTNVAVSVGEADIFLSWEAPDTGTADGYHIQYGEQDSQELQTESLTAGQTSYTHAGSTEGVVYAYSVRAHNTAGQSP